MRRSGCPMVQAPQGRTMTGQGACQAGCRRRCDDSAGLIELAIKEIGCCPAVFLSVCHAIETGSPIFLGSAPPLFHDVPALVHVTYLQTVPVAKWIIDQRSRVAFPRYVQILEYSPNTLLGAFQ